MLPVILVITNCGKYNTNVYYVPQEIYETKKKFIFDVIVNGSNDVSDEINNEVMNLFESWDKFMDMDDEGGPVKRNEVKIMDVVVINELEYHHKFEQNKKKKELLEQCRRTKINMMIKVFPQRHKGFTNPLQKK